MIRPDIIEHIETLADNYEFIFPEKSLRGLQGELLGKNIGGAVEFHDHRPYYLGDDIRHIDWLAYGRSEEYVLKSYREDITPTTEILMDFSRSMGRGEDKERLSRSVGLFLLSLFSSQSIAPTLWKCGSVPEKIRFDRKKAVADIDYNGRSTLMDMLNSGYIRSKPNSMRIIISDFLFPHSPAYFIRQVSSKAAGVLVVQLLSVSDTNPGLTGRVLLEDCETREKMGLKITERTVTSYTKRISGISRGLENACHQMGAGFVSTVSEKGLENVLQKMINAGFLRQK